VIFQGQTNPIEEFFTVLGYWDRIFSGFLSTMWLYGWALMIGFFFGLFLSLLRQYGGVVSSRVAAAYIEFIRGTPLIAQLFFIFYGLNIPVGSWNFLTEFKMLDKDITFIFLNHRVLFSMSHLALIEQLIRLNISEVL